MRSLIIAAIRDIANLYKTLPFNLVSNVDYGDTCPEGFVLASDDNYRRMNDGLNNLAEEVKAMLPSAQEVIEALEMSNHRYTGETLSDFLSFIGCDTYTNEVNDAFPYM